MFLQQEKSNENPQLNMSGLNVPEIKNLAEAKKSYTKVLDLSRNGKTLDVSAEDYNLALAYLIETRRASWVDVSMRTTTGAVKKTAKKAKTPKKTTAKAAKQAKVDAAVASLNSLDNLKGF